MREAGRRRGVRGTGGVCGAGDPIFFGIGAAGGVVNGGDPFLVLNYVALFSARVSRVIR